MVLQEINPFCVVLYLSIKSVASFTVCNPHNNKIKHQNLDLKRNMQLHNIILYVTIVSIALLSFVTLSRVYKLESSDEFSSKSKSDRNHTTTGGRRRLTETTTASNNPFMDSVCLDFIQDSTLEISIPTVSVVIVARNEERSALLATVRIYLFYIFLYYTTYKQLYEEYFY